MKVSSLMVGILALSLGGCEIHQVAKHVTKKVGIPVHVRTTEDDECMQSTLDSLVKEYEGLSSSQKRKLRKNLSMYRSIILNRSEKVQEVHGTLTRVFLIKSRKKSDCGGRLCTAYQGYVAQKDICDENGICDGRRWIGENPVTHVKAGDSLEITPQMGLDQTYLTYYQTLQKATFDQANTIDETSLLWQEDKLYKLVNVPPKRKIAQSFKAPINGIYCSPAIHLKDLF